MLGALILGFLDRRMDGVEGDEQKQRVVFGRALLDQFNSRGLDELGGVALFTQGDAMPLPVEAAGKHTIKVTDAAIEMAVERVKAALLRPVRGVCIAQVPFADEMGLVASAFEIFRQGLPLQRQAFCRVPLDGSVDAMSGGELASKQGGPSG